MVPTPAPLFLVEGTGLRRPILSPLFLGDSLTMLHGPRGVGKSYLALAVARAAAAGEDLLGWRARRPLRVLYIDGELDPQDLRQRLGSLGRVPESLYFLSALGPGRALPDLGNQAGQRRIWDRDTQPMGPADLVVLDSLSSLVGAGHVTPQAWRSLRTWMMALRAAGSAVLAVHHSSERGNPRGPGHREDVFDLVLRLCRPDGWQPRDGLAFELHVAKARWLAGRILDPIEVRMATDARDRATWHHQPAALDDRDRLAALLAQGLNPGQAAHRLGISRSKAYRLREQVVRLGLIDPPAPRT